jgi:nicotinamide-nucleotide amidase
MNISEILRVTIRGRHVSQELFNKQKVEAIRAELVSLKETVAVAESATAGLLQLALASAEEASQFFQGGITAYNVGQKTLQLNVEPIHALATNCVSETVTTQMALNVCARFRSHWGIGVTGFAAPVPESNQQVFGWYAIAHQGKIVRVARVDGKDGGVLANQSAFVNVILDNFATVAKARRL